MQWLLFARSLLCLHQTLMVGGFALEQGTPRKLEDFKRSQLYCCLAQRCSVWLACGVAHGTRFQITSALHRGLYESWPKQLLFRRGKMTSAERPV